jgi:plasmid stability protein
MGSLHRAQILLSEEQHQALATQAALEGRSISDLTREIIARYLAEREETRRQSQLETLDRARKLRQQIREEHGGQPLAIDVTDMIHQMREERDEQILRAGRS